MSRLTEFIMQLHRQSLGQVLVVYVGAAWACFELIDAVAGRLSLPAWLPGLAIVLFLLGLPFVVATALVHEEAAPPSAQLSPSREPGSTGAPARHAARRRRILTWRSAGATFVVALAAWGLVAAGWLLLGGSGGGGATSGGERPSVAALPFVNLSGREEDAFFTQGVHSEILTHLQKIGGLRVVSRTSVMGYQDSPKNAREIGRELDASYLLEGEVQRGADRVRVNVQLIDARTDEGVWADDYDRMLSIRELLNVQSEIAQRVALELRARLTPGERTRIESAPTDDLGAYQAYLRGQYYMNLPHFTEESLSRAMAEFGRAVQLDTSFALAYAALAQAEAQKVYFWTDASERQREAATLAVKRALRMDPESPDVLLAYGLYHLWVNRNPESALEAIERAAGGLPGDPGVHEARAWVYELQGRMEEAIEEYRIALELSPRDAALYTYLALDHWLLREYDRAEAYADSAIVLAPDQLWPNLAKVFVIWSGRGADAESDAILEAVPGDDAWLTWSRYTQRMAEDRYADALLMLSQMDSSWVRLKMWALPKSLMEAQAYGAMGRSEEAGRALAAAKLSLEREVRNCPWDPRYHSSLGLVYAALGRSDEAVAAGRRAVELLPLSRDAFYGIPYIDALAAIHASLGQDSAAIEEIETLLDVPSWISPAYLRADPRFDPLRENPRFLELLARYEQHARPEGG